MAILPTTNETTNSKSDLFYPRNLRSGICSALLNRSRKWEKRKSSENSLCIFVDETSLSREAKSEQKIQPKE